MGQQSIRQEARRAALDAQSKRRRERAEREKRLEDLAVGVLVAVRERNVAVAEADRPGGEGTADAPAHANTIVSVLDLHLGVDWSHLLPARC